MNLVPLKKDNSKCDLNDSTDNIDSVGVMFNHGVLSDLVTRVSHLEDKMRELNVDKYKMYLRSLIEQGRLYYWKLYGESYKNKFGDYVREDMVYDAESDELKPVYSPKYWKHFVNKSLPSDIVFRDELSGGAGSTYSSLSTDVHDIDEEKAAMAVKCFDDDKYKELFRIVYGKSVENV
mmetsp:Transcript_7059/g.10498  ORF Transcript_7059/g.10498 Transcript_7059/m.10498 type:complete len:178 (-) Transcript_7059:207-740(-)